MPGERQNLPSGTVTFLLTDVVGSSHLWDERPGEARAMVARSRALIEESTRSSGGVCPIEQGEGDSTVSAFSRASDAAAAAAAQEALSRGTASGVAGWRCGWRCTPVRPNRPPTGRTPARC
jgi:class 3 adenylate cyclase